MDHPWQILVASSDIESRQRVVEILAKQGLDPVWSSTIRQCLEILAQGNVGLVFCDRNLADGGYRDLLTAASRRPARGMVPIVLMSSVIDAEEYQSAKSCGLFEAIASPCRPTDVEWMVIRAKRDQWAQSKRLMIGSTGRNRSVAN